MVGFSWDGSFVAGASDEGNGIEIVSLGSLPVLVSLALPKVYTSAKECFPGVI